MKKFILLSLISFSTWSQCFQEFSDRSQIYLIYSKGFEDHIIQSYHKKLDGRFLASDEIYRNKNDEVVWESGDMKKVTEIELMRDFYKIKCPF